MYAAMLQCVRIILGGCHDNGYAHLLSKLETENVLPGKVMLLQCHSFAAGLDRFSPSTFPRVRFGDLYMETKLESGKTMKYAQVAADGVLQVARKSTSPKATAVVEVSRKKTEPDYGISLRILIDVGVYLSLKNLSPHPCNSYYLNPQKCSKSDCKYSHSHKLDANQLTALVHYSRKTPCDAFHKYGNCHYGDACIRGHECPDNIDGKCWNSGCKLSHPGDGAFV